MPADLENRGELTHRGLHLGLVKGGIPGSIIRYMLMD